MPRHVSAETEIPVKKVKRSEAAAWRVRQLSELMQNILGSCAVRGAINLTLAHPRVNRYEKQGKDAAEWMPNLNECWFAARIVEVRRKYRLTIDRREVETLERVLSACPSTEMVIGDCAASGPEPRKIIPSRSVDAPRLWDDNRNGRITCAEAPWHCTRAA